MPIFDKPHVNHENHLCSVVAAGTTLDEYKKLVTNPKFICKSCGRVAEKEEHLCNVAPL